MRREQYPVRRMLIVGLIMLGAQLMVAIQVFHLVALRKPASGTVVAAPLPTSDRMGHVTDRQGRLLAMDVPVYDVVIERALIPAWFWDDLASWLASLGLTEAQAQVLGDGERWLFPDVDPEVAKAVRAKQEELLTSGYGYWLGVTRRWRRWYPHRSLAAHVLGFRNEEGIFSGGMHQVYAPFLRQCEGLQPERVVQRPLPGEGPPFLPSYWGCDVVLTLDLGVQYQVEKVLAEDAEAYAAEWAVAIVMDPQDGQIWAAASWPTFDLNRYSQVTDERAFQNRITQFSYEPGSVVKPMTWAAAVDSGVVTETTPYEDVPVWEFGAISIRNADGLGHGVVTPPQVLAQSLNVPTAQVAVHMGPTHFYRYMQLFGFGQRTEIDVWPETEGVIRRPGNPNWSLADLATNAFGQGMEATPVQLVRAMAVLANGGYRVMPHVLKGFIKDGVYYEVQWPRGRRVISQTTAQMLTKWLVGTVDFLSTLGRVQGITVAGKTGTAETYEENLVDVTFIGYFPADAPRALILVAFGRPKNDAFTEAPDQVWAARTAYPTFVRMVEAVAPLLGITPETED